MMTSAWGGLLGGGEPLVGEGGHPAHKQNRSEDKAPPPRPGFLVLVPLACSFLKNRCFQPEATDDLLD